MANPATPADIEARWRPLTDQETTNAQTFLDDAWVMLKRRMAAVDVDIEAVIAEDEDLSADVIRVLCASVLRVLKNPDGKRRESIDDYSWERDEAVSAGLLYLDDDDLDALVPGTGSQGRAFTIDPMAGWSWPPVD